VGITRCIDARRFAPMKGPMVTQSLRGLKDAGPMHWRGDRFDPKNPLDEDAAFERFNPAFDSLLGGAVLEDGEMDAFREFALTLRYPPNPIADFGPASAPEPLYFVEKTDFRVRSCNECHRVPLGADGLSSFEAAPQDMKIPHLRNQYQKVGMLAGPNTTRALRGFGFLHDGSVPSVFDFLNIPLFTFPGDAPGQLAESPRRTLEDLLLKFPTGLAPIVGQQVTLGANPSPVFVDFLVNKLIARAQAGDCDLVAKARSSGKWRGWLYEPSLSDGTTVTKFRADDDSISDESLIRASAAVPGQEVTYTCVPPGSGRRIAIDRDSDTVVDGNDTSTEPPKHVVQ
jgi:hypothetical protein